MVVAAVLLHQALQQMAGPQTLVMLKLKLYLSSYQALTMELAIHGKDVTVFMLTFTR